MTLSKKFGLLIVAGVLGVFSVRTWNLHHEGQSGFGPFPVRIIEEVHFTDTPVRNALEELSRKWGVGIEVDWDALKEIEAAPDATVTLRLFNLSGESMLRNVLSQIGRADRGTVVLLRGRNSVTVTTSNRVQPHTELRMYDLGSVAMRFGIPADEALLRSSTQFQNRSDGVKLLILPTRLAEEAGNGKAFGEWQGRLFVNGSVDEHRLIEQALHRLEQMENDKSPLRPMVEPIPLLTEESR